MDEGTAERLAENERRFRAVNERLRVDLDAVAGDRDRVDYVCECSSAGCRETVTLTSAEYGSVRDDEDRFALVAGHEQPEIERVVERHAGHVVVEKVGG